MYVTAVTHHGHKKNENHALIWAEMLNVSFHRAQLTCTGNLASPFHPSNLVLTFSLASPAAESTSEHCVIDVTWPAGYFRICTADCAGLTFTCYQWHRPTVHLSGSGCFLYKCSAQLHIGWQFQMSSLMFIVPLILENNRCVVPCDELFFRLNLHYCNWC